jgi:hypothetical protein
MRCGRTPWRTHAEADRAKPGPSWVVGERPVSLPLCRESGNAIRPEAPPADKSAQIADFLAAAPPCPAGGALNRATVPPATRCDPDNRSAHRPGAGGSPWAAGRHASADPSVQSPARPEYLRHVIATPVLSSSVTVRRRVALTMTLGLLTVAALLVGVLSQAPRTVLASNSLPVRGRLGPLRPHTAVCQSHERLPRASAALRLSLNGYIGPAVTLTVSHAGRIVGRGHRSAGWLGSSLTFPLEPEAARGLDATICLTRDSGPLFLGINGGYAPRSRAATVDGKALPGRMRIEYLASGRRSWLSLAEQVARRLGLGHAPSGTWLAPLLTAMMALAVGLAAWVLLRESPNE